VLVAMQLIFDVALQVDAFPVIVCALCVERWWKQWGKDGAKPAAKMAFNTFVLAVVIEFVMVSDFALALIEASPLLMPAFTAVAIGILGRYRGLRLSEIHRFAPIWLERRRQARMKAESDQLELDLEPVTWEERRAAAPPLEGMWVINSPEDLLTKRRRRVPQPIVPNRDAQFEPRLDANGRPMIHNAWIIRSAEDV
jgi:7 transmembrane helices usually fused to an inactive transglutaminase